MGPNLHFCCMRLPFPETSLADIFCNCDRFQEIWICIFRIQSHCVCFLTIVTYIYIYQISSEITKHRTMSSIPPGTPCYLVGIFRPTRKHIFFRYKNFSLIGKYYTYTQRIVSTTVWTLQVKKSIIFLILMSEIAKIHAWNKIQ